MKSEFALAFNQICAEYNLPRDVVLEAVQAALVTAYRRDWNVTPNQNLNAEINMDNGLAKIYVEKEVVEKIEEPESQITLQKARRINPRVQLGETVMVDSTPRNFGRIAAQTAKQVITQRLREAERESQYTRFSRQANEIIIGTVQSINPQGLTLHLERREEAHMPRREQIPGERYHLHQKIRVYVLDVRRTPRGPQITVSRSHPSMLRRLLELEVPEIRSGQVEIKAIAREAGSRSKIAVISHQPGLDAVGTCVGMRGIRIQTISRELNGERIDVVEWAPEPGKFIANALSLDKVISVVVDENSEGGKTASVVVLDDQLSLAIGRSGQNARLAAKLTGWRVDIQGVTEAAVWALEEINEAPEILTNQREVAALVPRVASVLRTHERERYPYSDEELSTMKAVIEGVRQALIEKRNRERPGARQTKARRKAQELAEAEKRAAEEVARSSVPERAYETPLEALNLSEKVLGHLTRNGLENVGQVMERVALGDEALLMLTGIGAKALNEIKTAVEYSTFTFVEEEEGEESKLATEAEAEAKTEVAEETEARMVAAEKAEEVALEILEDQEVEVEAEAALEEEREAKAEAEAEVEAEIEEEAAEIETTEVEVAEEKEEADLLESEPESEEEDEELEFEADFPSPDEYDYDEDDLFEEDRSSKKKRRKKRRRRTLVFDEKTGETFAVRRRRSSENWEEYLDY